MLKPLSFVIVGSGWRAMFFVRIAKRYPELFHLNYLLCRGGEKAERLRREEGIPATTSVQVCEDSHPDFIVIAVSWDAAFTLTKEWIKKGYPVLEETPAATTEEQLEELWELHRNGAHIQIAEQYLRYPLLASGLRAIRQGLLGEPHVVELSLVHEYHAASLIRNMLNLGLNSQESLKNGLPAFKLWGRQYIFPVVETDSRQGPVTDGSVKSQTRTRVTIEFEGGKMAFYDFSGVQYHTFIRARHINVQGVKGEWNDTLLRYVDSSFHPVKEQLRPGLDPAYPDLETPQLQELSSIWKPEVHMENWQDEYAIATMMLDMGEFIENDCGGYPLAEALEDAYIWMLMKKAVQNPGRIITSRPHSWQRGQ